MKKAIASTLVPMCALLLVMCVCATSLLTDTADTLTVYILTDYESAVKQDSTQNEGKTVIIDAGHGGEDPGAVGLSGTLEKELNLEISKLLKETLTLCGFTVVMTREEDVLLDGADDGTSKKNRDLRNRLQFTKDYPEAVFISIHMNKFSLESCSGLQVYYSGNHPESESLAETVRLTVKQRIAPGNDRQIKKATSSIYILHRSEIPSILIECGFLSNAAEEARLNDEQYRRELAFAICNAVISCYG